MQLRLDRQLTSNNDGTPECYGNVADPASLIPGCVPLNLFAGPGAIPMDQLAGLSAELTDTYNTRQNQAEISVSGNLFELPGGPMGWALGYAYGDTDYSYRPDSAKALGIVTGNKGAGTSGSLTNSSFFGELALPLFDNGNQKLDMRAGARYDSYEQFDAESTYSSGAEFYVVKELKVRATYGTVFRTPTITDLYGGPGRQLPAVQRSLHPRGGGSSTCGLRAGGRAVRHPGAGQGGRQSQAARRKLVIRSRRA